MTSSKKLEASLIPKAWLVLMSPHVRISLYLALKTELPWSKCPPWGPGMAMLGLCRSGHLILNCLKFAPQSVQLKRLPHAAFFSSLPCFFPKKRFPLPLVQAGVSHYVLLPGLLGGAGHREGLCGGPCVLLGLGEGTWKWWSSFASATQNSIVLSGPQFPH